MAAEEDSRIGSLAKSIRATRTSDQVELTGFNSAQVSDLASAFEKPIPCTKMFRIAFVVGGGKKVRQKYRPELPVELQDALKAVGFQEDRGASCCMESAGTFKYQHDTDKDLKFVYVFPKLDVEEGKKLEGGGDGGVEGVGGFAANSPEHKCAVSSFDLFQKMVEKKCETFSQLRRLLALLKTLQGKLAAFDEKLASGEQLEAADMELYDEVEEIPEKVEWTKARLESMIDQGKLLKKEKATIVREYAGKVEQIEAAVRDARENENEKKAKKLLAQLQVLAQKQAAVEAVSPVTKPVGKYDRDIKEIRKELKALDKIENAKGLQDISELKKLNARPKLEERLAELQEANEGWFTSQE